MPRRSQKERRSKHEQAGNTQDTSPGGNSWKILFGGDVASLDLETSEPTFQDQALECNFIEESSDNCKVFVCNRMRDGSVCEAETQLYIPVSNNRIVFSAINSTKQVSSQVRARGRKTKLTIFYFAKVKATLIFGQYLCQFSPLIPGTTTTCSVRTDIHIYKFVIGVYPSHQNTRKELLIIKI
jgi:hypothetical protein